VAFWTRELGLAKQQIAVMHSLGIWNLFTGDGNHPGPGVMATIPELTEMTRVGMRVDVAGATRWCGRLERKMLRYMKLWSRMFPEVNPSSSQQLQKLLYKDWGLPVQETKGDGVSVNELALVKLGSFVEAQRGNINFPGDWHEDKRANQRTFDLLLKIREVKKILKTYVEPAMLTEKQWVHPSYLPVSKDDEKGGMKLASKGNTATGRLVAYDPNIQNQPKSVRWLYIPDEEDHCFIQADYKSAELYVLAGASGDKRLMEDLQGDLHQANADRLGVDRKIAKNVTYASQYLASPSKQSEMILGQAHLYVSPAECLVVANGIWNYYTDATAYKQYLVSLCSEKRMIRNAFGRIRFFHDGGAPAAVNFIPQSTVADILWCVLAPIAQMCRKYKARLVTTVHDSILVSCPVKNREIVAQKMKDIMEKRFDCVAKDFYIPVEIEMGDAGASWGHLEKWEDAA
jgi:DNA polymerase I-like protein with 3'-5' exonuclease and polymerase domains